MKFSYGMTDTGTRLHLAREGGSVSLCGHELDATGEPVDTRAVLTPATSWALCRHCRTALVRLTS